MNNEQHPIAAPYTFWQLINKYDSIEIPIIQRDYAHGRIEDDTIVEIRNRFIEDLFNALVNEDGKTLELDFIYGSVQKLSNTLLLLDGQQRITTLFLLHWFIAEKEGYHNVAQEQLEKFTYKTRVSSREFCQALIENKCSHISKISNINKNSEQWFSNILKNERWYRASWDKDPTIRAMLVVLDSIYNYVNNDSLWNNKLWPKLTEQLPATPEPFVSAEKLLPDGNELVMNGSNTNKAPICFQFIPLEEFGLSEDLYIKMNARGKQLTAFEKFKASLEYKIKKEGWDKDKKPQETFSCKADNEWLDIFWKLSGCDPESCDLMFARCIAAVEMYSLAMNGDGSKKKNRPSKIQQIYSDSKFISADSFNEQDYQMLCDTLDTYVDTENLLNCQLETWGLWNITYAEDILLCFRNVSTMTYQQCALFYAQTQYLINYRQRDSNPSNFDIFKFSCWMRVARNIIYNALKDGTASERFMSVIPLLHELIEKMEDGSIYDMLSSSPRLESSFQKQQVKHECLKATILKNNNWLSNNDAQSNIIFALEDCDFYRGNINFPLYCIDYFGMEQTHKEMETDKRATLEKIKINTDRYLGREEQISSEFRRALLASSEMHHLNSRWHEFESKWSTRYEADKYFLIPNREFLSSFSHSDEKPEGTEIEHRAYLKNFFEQLASPGAEPKKIIDDCVKSAQFSKICWWKQSIIEHAGTLLLHDKKECSCVIPISKGKSNILVVVWGTNPGKHNVREIPL